MESFIDQKRDAYWRFIPGPKDPKPESVITKIITSAFKYWEQYINVNFIEGDNGLKTIKISFASGKHNCLNSFDGPKGVLAHATFSYKNTTTLFIHFDASEQWCFDNTISIFKIFEFCPYFYNVCVHEIGHVLGLLHSTHKNSVMYTNYSRYIDCALPSEIKYLQKIYGIRKGAPEPEDYGNFNFFVRIYYREIILSIFLLMFALLCGSLAKWQINKINKK